MPQFKDDNNNDSKINNELKLSEKIEIYLYEYLGIKFEAPIKWVNSISIIILHALGVYGLFIYPFKAYICTTLWGKFTWI
jgi:hypothetical protein